MELKHSTNAASPTGLQKIVLPLAGLKGTVALSAASRALVIFAHGSGSSRLSPLNTYVATALNRADLATLLFDLLTEEEAVGRANVFDIPLLAHRLKMAKTWAASDDLTRHLPVGYFGASTGAAAALLAASEVRAQVFAVVSRGGRPDLALPALEGVRAPTLLIVGGLDTQMLTLNEAAYQALGCEKVLEVVPGATHLFEEPGPLDQVIALTRDWLVDHFDLSGTAT